MSIVKGTTQIKLNWISFSLSGAAWVTIGNIETNKWSEKKTMVIMCCRHKNFMLSAKTRTCQTYSMYVFCIYLYNI